TIRVVEKVAAQDRTALEILIEKEEAARFEEFKAEIRALLAQERPLLRLFDCFCADICKPKDQARKLKLPVRHIQDLQRRLRRKLAAHGYMPFFLEKQDSGQLCYFVTGLYAMTCESTRKNLRARCLNFDSRLL